jgi:hypothetical protein
MAIPKKVSSADCNLKQPNSDDPPEVFAFSYGNWSSSDYDSIGC